MKRALLVVDVQNDYFPGGQLPATYPDGHFANLLTAMDAATAAGVPVVVIQHTCPAEMPFFRHRTPGWNLHPEVAARPRDHHIEKYYPGCFTGSDLETWLRSHGITTVAIVGYSTHMCCDATAREAVYRGLKVEFLADATGTLDVMTLTGGIKAEELYRATLAAQRAFGEILDTARWVERLRAETREQKV